MVYREAKSIKKATISIKARLYLKSGFGCRTSVGEMFCCVGREDQLLKYCWGGGSSSIEMYKRRKEGQRKQRGGGGRKKGWAVMRGKEKKGGREKKERKGEKRDGGMETRRGLARMRVGEKIELAWRGCHF